MVRKERAKRKRDLACRADKAAEAAFRKARSRSWS